MTDRRHDDDDVRGRVEEIRVQLLRSVNFARTGVVIVGTTVVVALILTFHLNAQRANDIEDSRRDTIRTACEETNSRNRETVQRIRVLATRDKRPDIEERVENTIQLIDALSPVQDCDRLAERLAP